MLIKFETDAIVVNGNDKLTNYLHPVEYKDEMIEIPANFLELCHERQLKIIDKNTFIKYSDWEYEGEYRAIVRFDHTENKRYIDLSNGSILEVILGLNCDLETELLVKSILTREDYQRVVLKRATLHNRKYIMRYVDIIPVLNTNSGSLL